ncbi:MAG: hypothetical protein ABJF23_32865 [Bryobacteraceae bacterium]
MLIAVLATACTAPAQNNAVTDWATIIQPAVNNASAPRPPASSEVLHTIVHLAVYDAVVAIEGGFRPYTATIKAPPEADVRAAVATAAHRTARARVAASQTAYLDGQYVTYMANIPDGPAKSAGMQVGQAAADAMITLRMSDGFNNAANYVCSSNPPPPGEFEPNGGCGSQPVDAILGQVKPFVIKNPNQFRPSGPDPLTSNAYEEDFTETRDYGRSNSSLRTAEQTDIAYFWAEHTYVHWNRNLVSLAISRGLNVRDTARFFALVHTAASDAVISGFAAKYFYKSWRPRTAIPRADTDGNPDTDADPAWTPLLTVNHPEYPSAHAFWSTAVTDAVARYFGTNKIRWTLTTSKAAVPQLIQTERTYQNLNQVTREIDDARVWAGLHWRNSMRDGAQIGRKVVRHVFDEFGRTNEDHESTWRR